MTLSFDRLQALRDCCRDDASFERLKALLAIAPDPQDSALILSSDQPFVNSLANSLDDVAIALSAAVDRQRERHYQAMLDACPDMIFRVSRDGQYLDFKGTGVAHELPRDALIGRYIEEFLPPDVTDLCMKTIHKALATGTLQSCGYKFLTPAGERDYEARIVTCSENEVLAIVRDVTEQTQTEQELMTSQERLKSFFEATSEAVILHDFQTILDVNPATEAMFGYSYDELIGMPVLNLVAPGSKQQVQARWQALTYPEQPYEYEDVGVRKDGSTFVGTVCAQAIQFQGKLVRVAGIRDISAQKQTEQQIQASATRDRLLREMTLRIRQSLDLGQILNTTVCEVRQFFQADRVFIARNQADQHGVVVAESVVNTVPSAIGNTIYTEKSWDVVTSLFHAGKVQVLNDVLNELDSKTVPTVLQNYYETYQIRAGMAVPLMIQDSIAGLLVVHQCHEPRQWQSFEVAFLERLATVVAIATQQADLYQQVQELNTNLEQQVQDRTAQLEKRMVELQELNQLKDDFLNAFSHDLRTPMMGMSLVLSNLLQSEQDHLSIARPILERMLHSTEHQLELLNSLLAAHSCETKGIVLQYQPIQVGTLLRQVGSELTSLAQKHQATLICDVADEMPRVSADPTQLRRVFENLISNGLHHNPPGITLRLSATAGADEIWVTVEDDGVGIDPDLCDRLFDRYTRGQRSRHLTGIGLGLYLCQQIVTAHGGQIGVDSTINQGTTFWLTLPLAQPKR